MTAKSPNSDHSESEWTKLTNKLQKIEALNKDEKIFEEIKLAKEHNLSLEEFAKIIHFHKASISFSNIRRKRIGFLRIDLWIVYLWYSLEKHKVFTILEKLGYLSLVFGLLIFLLEIPQKNKKLEYEAWEIINDNQGVPASGGRLKALQDLNQKSFIRGGQVSLAGINLENAIIPQINLENSILSNSNFTDANLTNIKITKKELRINNTWRNANLGGKTPEEFAQSKGLAPKPLRFSNK